MKKWFIHSVNESGEYYGLFTNNLKGDLLDDFCIQFEIDDESGSFGGKDLRVSVSRTITSSSDIYLYKVDLKTDGYQKESWHFNMFSSGWEDEMEDFISENLDEIEMGIGESLKVKRFGDFL